MSAERRGADGRMWKLAMWDEDEIEEDDEGDEDKVDRGLVVSIERVKDSVLLSQQMI